LSESLVGSLKDLMPTRQLIEREWTTHGTCSGLSPEQFFAAMRQAYASVNMPQLKSGAGDENRTTHQVVNAFRSRDPGLTPQAIVVTCSDNPARLREVRICLSKDLASQYCTGETIAASCQSANIQIPAGH
jgi:ribonuclease T2